MVKDFLTFIAKGIDEGNAFTVALKKAQESGAEEFEFEGKTYKTKGNDLKEDEATAPSAPAKIKKFEEFLKDENSEDVEKEVEIDSEEIADVDAEEADAEEADVDAEEQVDKPA